MMDATDMSTPVTRGELREEFDRFRQQLEDRLEHRLALLATKAELELWGGALLARIESGERRLYEYIKSNEQQLIERIDRTAQALHVDLARHAKALYESMATLISASDEKYKDLPGRVSRLEAAVFAPKQVP